MSLVDDIYILERSDEGILKRAEAVFKESPLSLNLAKSKEYKIEDVRRDGLCALGTYLGPPQGRLDFLA